MTFKDFWNMPIKKIIPDKDTRHIKKILSSEYLTDKQKDKFRRIIRGQGITEDSLTEDSLTFNIIEWIYSNPGEVFGIIVLIIILIILLFISWIAAIIWIIIVGVITIGYKITEAY